MATETDLTPEEIAFREETVKRHLLELLSTEYPSGRAVPLAQNWWETVSKIVDFYQDEPNGRLGKSKVREGDESDRAQAQMVALTQEIQGFLGADRLRDGTQRNEAGTEALNQLNGWFGRVSEVQIAGIAKVIARSGLPLYSKSHAERVRETTAKVKKQELEERGE